MSAPSEHLNSRFRSSNTSYPYGDVISIIVPTGGAGQHLFTRNSVVTGNLEVRTVLTHASNNPVVYIDGNILACFSRYRLLQGSTVLSDWATFNKNSLALLDIQKPIQDRSSDSITMLSGLLQGFGSGQALTTYITGDSRDGTTTRITTVPFSFQIPSGLLGVSNSRAVPLSKMGAADLEIQFQLEDLNNPFVCSLPGITIPQWSINNVYYDAKLVKLPGDIESSLMSAIGQEILISCVDFKAEVKTINAGITSFIDKFAFQYSSIKSLFFFLMNSTSVSSSNAAATTTYSQSNRSGSYISDFQVALSGVPFPPIPISGKPLLFQNLLRSLHMTSNVQNSGVIQYLNWMPILHVGTTACDVFGTGYVDNKTVFGLDLDRFDASSETLLSGMNSFGQMLDLRLNFSTAYTVPQNLYCFAMYDVLYEISNGMVIVKN
jgi:hypothetical protein